MRHGYYQASGRAAAAMVPVNVGTANTICALMNARRDNVPLLLMAGRTPLTQAGDIASRSAPIHWGQESFDQAGVVREWTKWDYELRAGQNVDEVVARALDVALAEPRGPVYLTLPREVLAAPAAAQWAERPLPATQHAPPAPSSSHVEQLADWVAAAQFPLVLTANLGRDLEAVAALDALARRFAIPVAEPHPSCVNLPASHPFATGMAGTELLSRADLVIVADCEVPWYPRYAAPRADAKIVHLGADPLYERYPLRAFPAHLALTGRTSTALTALAAALDARGGIDASALRTRTAAIAEVNAARAARRAALLERARSEKPIRYAWVGECVRKALPKDALVVTELGVSSEQLALEEPGSLLGVSIGGGLGFGLGASLGAKLASPQRTVVSTVGDGSYMFGNPTPFHLVSRAAGLPVLTIVCNNRRWQAVESATRVVYPDGRAANAPKMPLVELEPSPEFTKVAEASAAWTRRVDDPAELPAALEAALEAVAGGNQALLDVRMEHGVR